MAETCYDASFVKLLLKDKGVNKYSDLVVLQKNTTQTQVLKQLKLKPKKTLIVGQPLASDASILDMEQQGERAGYQRASERFLQQHPRALGFLKQNGDLSTSVLIGALAEDWLTN